MAERFNLSELTVRERQVALFFLVVAILAGGLAFLGLGRAEDPAFTVRVGVVSAAWPGATAEEMTRQVADPIERSLGEIADVYRIETTARPGRVDILVEFQDFVPARVMPDRFYQIRKRMGDLTPTLPRGVQGPFINDEFSDVYFRLVGLAAPGVPTRLMVEQAEALRDGLARIPGVQKARVLGERPQRLFVELDQTRIALLGIAPAAVAEAIAASNDIAAAGLIETTGPRLVLRAATGRADPDALARVPLRAGGQVFTLGEVARITRGVEDPPSYLVRVGGEDSVLLGVVMARGMNGLALGARLETFFTEVATTLPAGFTLRPVTNQADAITQAVDLFQVKFLMAVAVVMGVSFLAIGWRAGLIVGIAVPVTLGITFLLMLAQGMPLDRITLGALIIALGLLVDDAIIAIEMMLVKLEEGWDRMSAAAHAWTVTAAPMFWGTLATAIGFVPIGFANSSVGEYAGNIFWVVAIALLVSWFVAVTFTPMLGTLLLREVPHGVHAEGWLLRCWRRVVQGCVRFRGSVTLATFALLALAITGMATVVPQQFFPASDRPEVLVDIQLPPGSSIAATDAVARRVEEAMRTRVEVRTLSAYVGAGAPRFFLSLNPETPDPAFAKIVAVTGSAAEREAVIAALRGQVEAGAFPEARVRVTTLLFGPPVQWPVAFRVLGPDAQALRGIAEEVRSVMAANRNVLDPHLDWGTRVPELRLALDEARIAALGLTAGDVARQLEANLSGAVAAEARIGTRSVAIVLRARDRFAADLASLPIRTPGGASVPLTQLGELVPHFADPVLKRLDRQLVLRVQADPVGAQAPDVERAVWSALGQLRAALPPGYRIEMAGTVEQSARGDASIAQLQPVMLVLLLSVVMLQVRRFSGLLLVMATAPLGVIGAVAGLLLAGKPFGFVALLGVIGLAGILIRNTLILVQQYQDNVSEGLPRDVALVEATVSRTRPVLLTAVAAALAFLPLAFDTFWGPLAAVLIGGTLIGTFVTLLFLPAFSAVILRIRLSGMPCEPQPQPRQSETRRVSSGLAER